jgi:hypothetical protein
MNTYQNNTDAEYYQAIDNFLYKFSENPEMDITEEIYKEFSELGVKPEKALKFKMIFTDIISEVPENMNYYEVNWFDLLEEGREYIPDLMEVIYRLENVFDDYEGLPEENPY